MGFGRDGKGVIIREQIPEFAVGALTHHAVKFLGTKPAIAEDFRMLKSEIVAKWQGGTAGDAKGLILGVADGALSQTEVEAAIEADGPLSPGAAAMDTAEVAMRPVWFIGVADDTQGKTDLTFRNDQGGGLLEFKPRWTFRATSSWVFFVYNSSGLLMTTGSDVDITAKHFGVWVQ